MALLVKTDVYRDLNLLTECFSHKLHRWDETDESWYVAHCRALGCRPHYPRRARNAAIAASTSSTERATT
jgi:hypothetical protein